LIERAGELIEVRSLLWSNGGDRCGAAADPDIGSARGMHRAVRGSTDDAAAAFAGFDQHLDLVVLVLLLIGALGASSKGGVAADVVAPKEQVRTAVRGVVPVPCLDATEHVSEPDALGGVPIEDPGSGVVEL